jgi:hypothetical protein
MMAVGSESSDCGSVGVLDSETGRSGCRKASSDVLTGGGFRFPMGRLLSAVTEVKDVVSNCQMKMKINAGALQ